MAERKILLVDDDESVRLALGRFLDSKGYAHVDADGVAAVRELLRGQYVDAAVVDFSLPDGDGCCSRGTAPSTWRSRRSRKAPSSS